jgi:hypothetical protein
MLHLWLQQRPPREPVPKYPWVKGCAAGTDRWPNSSLGQLRHQLLASTGFSLRLARSKGAASGEETLAGARKPHRNAEVCRREANFFAMV